MTYGDHVLLADLIDQIVSVINLVLYWVTFCKPICIISHKIHTMVKL